MFFSEAVVIKIKCVITVKCNITTVRTVQSLIFADILHRCGSSHLMKVCSADQLPVRYLDLKTEIYAGYLRLPVYKNVINIRKSSTGSSYTTITVYYCKLFINYRYKFTVATIQYQHYRYRVAYVG